MGGLPRFRTWFVRLTVLIVLPLLVVVHFVYEQVNTEDDEDSSWLREHQPLQHEVPHEVAQASNVLTDEEQDELLYGQELHRYDEIVDFRIVVLTRNRSSYLKELLASLNTLELDGDSARLEIWVDRLEDGEVDQATEKLVEGFNWKLGPARVHYEEKHVGTDWQWVNSWTPSNNTKDSHEIGLILEDDVKVSPFVYRWLKAVHRHYGREPEFFGATLTHYPSLRRQMNQNPTPELKVNDTVFYLALTGTWGLSPAPYYWHDFQIWFHKIRLTRPDFNPYSPMKLISSWFKQFEKMNMTEKLWLRWLVNFIYIERLFAIHSNLESYIKSSETCLTINMREPVLLFNDRRQDITQEKFCKLLKKWRRSYVKFPTETVKVGITGKLYTD